MISTVRELSRRPLKSDVAHNEQIAQALCDRLQQSPYLAIRQLTCEFREGAATLRGTVPTYHTRQIALATAKSVEGVKSVDDRIEVPTQGTAE